MRLNLMRTLLAAKAGIWTRNEIEKAEDYPAFQKSAVCPQTAPRTIICRADLSSYTVSLTSSLREMEVVAVQSAQLGVLHVSVSEPVEMTTS